MIRGSIQIRKTRPSTVCVLVLGCLFLPAAGARQASTGTGTSASATKKTGSGKTTSPTHQKSSASAVKSSSKTHTASRKRSSRNKSARTRGQQKIDSERAQAIQEALIREHYLSGEATGTWNQASEEAMRRYQADHGWQSKTVPDSRALIKLGLGPSKDHLLNPESAMTTVPDAPRAEPMSTTSHTAPPGADPAPPASAPSQNGSPGPQ
jgi:hypothetical protein